MKTLLFAVALLLFASASALELGAPFRDHMVLQRDRPVRVWGWAKAGECVRVSFAGQEKAATAAADGTWRVELDPMPASKEPRTLKVGTISLRDVLVGEVWIAGGQSNMAFPLHGTDPRFRDREGLLVAQSCHRPCVRFVRMQPAGAAEPLSRAHVAWCDARPENLLCGNSDGKISALAFYYALELNQALDVPVGIVAAAQSWTPIGAWTPREGSLSVPSLRAVADWRYVRDWSPTNVVRKGIVAPVEAGGHQPAALWNGMVAPLAPMSVRGVIWYQGCNDVSYAGTYCDKLHALYNGWSAKFENPELKFYVVQIAPHYGGSGSARLQMAQEKFAAEEPNAGIVHINDLGMKAEIHPDCKAPVAKRLAALALKRDYGFDGIVAESPSPVSALAEGPRVSIRFDACKELFALDPDRTLKADFELAGADGKFHPADIVNRAKDSGAQRAGLVDRPDTIVIESPEVAEPRKVRYLMSDAWKGVVCNEAHLPLGPFEMAVGKSDKGKR